MLALDGTTNGSELEQENKADTQQAHSAFHPPRCREWEKPGRGERYSGALMRKLRRSVFGWAEGGAKLRGNSSERPPASQQQRQQQHDHQQLQQQQKQCRISSVMGKKRVAAGCSRRRWSWPPTVAPGCLYISPMRC